MTVFASRRDTWLVVLIWTTILALTGGVGTLLSRGPWPRTLPGLIFLLASDALLLWVLYGTRYTIDADVLRIRCGPFRWSVPLHEITDITPTDDPSSAPACSLDRLRITYGGGKEILVSPEEQSAFVERLNVSRT